MSKFTDVLRRASGILLAAVLLTGCSSDDKGATRPELLDPVNASVDIAVAEVMSLTDISFYNGIVIPDVEEMCFESDGYLNGIYVVAGQQVEEGEVIASLVGKNYSQIIRLREEIENLEEQNAENFKYLEAELELQRLDGQDVAEMELRLKHEKETAALKLDEKRSRLETLEATDPGYTYIVSPRDCTVMSVTSTRTNSFIAAGTPVCALEGEDRSGLCITCEYINEKTYNKCIDAYALINGKRYEIEYLPYTKEELKVLSTNSIDPVSRFKITDDAGEVQAGEYAAVLTSFGVAENILAIPANSVYTDSNGKYVYKVVNNVRIKQPIVTGISNSAYVEIVEGLAEGDGVYVKN